MSDKEPFDVGDIVRITEERLKYEISTNLYDVDVTDGNLFTVMPKLTYSEYLSI